ncbi:prenyltransferase [Streptomyces sp. CS090A]|uniref:UbiA prenyltransferase family protein n=1 Tax=Streptomyces sp. CS090A TaxID=2162710 RepID=UPI000D510EEF|nr:UbiA prenyltransferase family protein [Streptomyces sp. CS090A]PVC88509.1 prenyltransferase [Streptomyces sp. CS090A]
MDITRSSPAPMRVVTAPPEAPDLTVLPAAVPLPGAPEVVLPAAVPLPEPLETVLPATVPLPEPPEIVLPAAVPLPGPAEAAAPGPVPTSVPPPADGRGLLRDLLALVRPGQWVKNLAVVPLALLDVRPWHLGAFGRIGWAVLGFTLASALVYVVNDLADRERDRLHPVKRNRPIASGRVSTTAATVLAGLIAASLTCWAVAGPAWQWWPTALYLALSVAYSQGLKHVPLVDAFIVASGFVLRLVQGALLVGGRISEWLALCVFALCLMLALGKRRHEMTAAGRAHRPALRGYTLAFLDHLVVLVAVLTAVSYVLYLRDDAALAAGASFVTLLSAPCAVFGLARYLQLLLVEEGGANPVHVLFRDRATLVNATLWAVLVSVALLLSRL